ncbi:DMT family transporter [Pseudodesulfovibrio piezophilus]|uniref:EamA domain-containing protein n=1 Tax=Pseudodesulfovibrio piezophilus (strain DSM 21447 / JCM 15486 / C1TLV30) TaxID=1322246 RepID=M1WUM3_PSEP2|nr:DMT family transporter [Pseudodesulfovibrio piezophilus]CCH47588.1 conserved membrane protein of unknown function [Pseudodesulfovibrio piezophilus C1TLV30]
MTNSRKALLYGLATVGLWSTVASAFKLSLRYLDPLQFLLCASTASLFALITISLIQGKLYELKRIKRSDLVRCALLGFLNPFLYYILLFKAYELLPAQEAQPLNYTWAITISLLSVPLLKQKMTGKDIGAIFTCYIGVLIISTHGEIFNLKFSNPLGVSLALTSTLIWAFYWIFNTTSALPPILILLLNFAFGLPFIFLTTLIFSELPSPNLWGLIGATYVGFFEMGITFALWLTAMKYAAQPNGGGTARIANLIFLSPFLSLFFIHLLVGEEILTTTIVGLIFIIIGTILMQCRSRQ